ncbi:MAG: radical SAM protein [Nanoarchaeota archaeon]
MKLLFLRPYLNGEGYEAPLGLLYLAAYVRKYVKGVEVTVLDLDILKLKKKGAAEELKKIAPDVVCVSAFSYNRFDGFELARLSKEVGAYVIFGGQHTTYIDEPTLRHFPYIDLIIRGEAEITFAEVIQRLQNGKKITEDIDGISYLYKEKFIRTKDRDFLDVQTLPWPAYDLVPMEKYKYYGVIGGRGCPYNCNFCGSPSFWKRKLRLRHANDVVDEIEHLIKTYGKKVVHMKDDVFTAHKIWAGEICDEIIKRKLNIEWECLTRVNLVDDAILKKMKTAGCRLIEYGIESGNEALMKSINKAINKDTARKAIASTRDNGVRYGTFFMIGHPGETAETLEDTFNFAWELRGDAVTFTLTDAIPGTALYELAKQKNYLPKDFEWHKNQLNLSGYAVPRFIQPHLSEEEMLSYSRRFKMRFAFYKLFDIQSKEDFKLLFFNEYIPYDFSWKSKRDLALFFSEALSAACRHFGFTQKIKGVALFPFFCGRIAKAHAVQAYRKFSSLLLSRGRISQELNLVD